MSKQSSSSFAISDTARVLPRIAAYLDNVSSTQFTAYDKLLFKPLFDRLNAFEGELYLYVQRQSPKRCKQLLDSLAPIHDLLESLSENATSDDVLAVCNKMVHLLQDSIAEYKVLLPVVKQPYLNDVEKALGIVTSIVKQFMSPCSPELQEKQKQADNMSWGEVVQGFWSSYEMLQALGAANEGQDVHSNKANDTTLASLAKEPAWDGIFRDEQGRRISITSPMRRPHMRRQVSDSSSRRDSDESSDYWGARHRPRRRLELSDEYSYSPSSSVEESYTDSDSSSRRGSVDSSDGGHTARRGDRNHNGWRR